MSKIDSISRHEGVLVIGIDCDVIKIVNLQDQQEWSISSELRAALVKECQLIDEEEGGQCGSSKAIELLRSNLTFDDLLVVEEDFTDLA